MPELMLLHVHSEPEFQTQAKLKSKINLLFSFPINFDDIINIIALGITAKLMIGIISITLVN